MEPERKIEKLLRAYAKKRRADAGDPLTLHPATRRLLLGEVARRKPKPENEEETSVSLWEFFRQRWALLAGFALVIFFGAALFLPTLSGAKKKAQSVTAMNNLTQIGVAAQMAAGENAGRLPASLAELTNQFVSDKVLTDPETGRPFSYVAGGEKLDGLSSNSVLAYSPADKQGRAVLFADGRVEVVTGTRLAELTSSSSSPLLASKGTTDRNLAGSPAAGQAEVEPDRSQVKLADQPNHAVSGGMLALNAPGAAPAALDRLAKAPGAAGSDLETPANAVQFASTATQSFGASAQNAFKNTVLQNRPAAVLANFQVQQLGQAIRVVDADGSVYDGALQTEEAVAQAEPAAELPATSTITATTQKDQERGKTRRDQSQAAQNYFFRVSGMNQTLKQKVVFAGNLIPSNLTLNGQQQLNYGGGIGGQAPSALTNQLPWANSIIAGTAVVADTNRIEINAVPQAP